jgi:hypothetical protein
MTGRLGEWTALAPTRHAGENELRIATQTHLRTNPQPFGNPRAIRVDQRIRGVHQAQQRINPLWLLEINNNRALAPKADILRLEIQSPGRSLDANDLGPHVREHHPGHRPWSDAREFDYLDPLQRSHRVLSTVPRRAPSV